MHTNGSAVFFDNHLLSDLLSERLFPGSSGST